MHTERIRRMLFRELPHHPLKVAAMILAHFSHMPVYYDATLCTRQKMRVDLSDVSHTHIAMFGDCEPEVTQMMKQVLSPGDIFIDGGANAGLKTGIGYSFVRDSGTVISVEPTPRTYQLLKYNSSRWSPRIFTHQLALSCQFETRTLTDFGHRRSGLNTLLSKPRDLPSLQGKKIEVRTITLDELVGDHNFSLAKLDVEGYEKHALNGSLHHLTRFHPDIIFETGNRDTSEVLQLFSKLGYGFFGLDNGNLKKLDFQTALLTLNVLASKT